MSSPTITLPNVEEMRRRLAKVEFDPPVAKEKFIVILIEYAGRELTGRGVVNMLQRAVVRYGRGVENISYEPLTSKFSDLIKALVSDRQVRKEALDDLKKRPYM